MAAGTGVWDKLFKQLTKPQPHVKVGIIGDKGGNADHGGISMIELGAVHEFGAPKVSIPERSFIRRTFRVRQKELGKTIGELVKRVNWKDSKSIEQALGKLGAWGAAQVKNTITEGAGLAAPGGGFAGEPLQERTIARKGSDRPLVDTGRLLNAITWKVEPK
jgi:hypothetical protein